MSALPPSARLILGLSAFLFLTLNIVQFSVFGAPFGATASLDARIFGYSAQEAHTFLEIIGEDGRRAFFGYFHWIDTVFPPLLAVSMVLVFRQIRPRRAGLVIGLYALFPLAYLLADLTENAFLMDLQIEEGFDLTARMACVATTLKYSMLCIAFGVLLVFALKERWSVK